MSTNQHRATVTEKLTETRAQRDALKDAGHFRRRQDERRVSYWLDRLDTVDESRSSRERSVSQ